MIDNSGEFSLEQISWTHAEIINKTKLLHSPPHHHDKTIIFISLIDCLVNSLLGVFVPISLLSMYCDYTSIK